MLSKINKTIIRWTWSLAKRTHPKIKAMHQRQLLKQSFDARKVIDALEDLLKPHAIANPLHRYGNDSDGGYIALIIGEEIDALISLGIEKDVSFDIEYAKKGIPCYQYDFSVKGPPYEHENFIFHKEKITASGGNIGETSLNDIFEKYTFDQCVLKIDIEGYEWESLESFKLDKYHHRISEIYLEFHDMHLLLDEAIQERYLSTIHKLRAYFTPFYFHPNNCSDLLIIGNKAFPEVFEASFISNKKLIASDKIRDFSDLEHDNSKTFPPISYQP